MNERKMDVILENDKCRVFMGDQWPTMIELRERTRVIANAIKDVDVRTAEALKIEYYALHEDMRCMVHDRIMARAHQFKPEHLARVLPVEKLAQVLSEDDFVGVFLR